MNVIKGPLCQIFNKSLQTGIFPNLMKIAKVIPLHKSGDTAIPDNYRPISLLPVVSKILERIVFNKMTNYLNENEILYQRQYGFCKGHSTTDAVTNLVLEILHGFEENQMILAVFIDLKKAFDSVSHSRIVLKLGQLGEKDTELEWFQNYLNERHQVVQINRTVSSAQKLTVGIPQGSLLGVLLFQLIINDIFTCLRYCVSILYADDTTLLLSGKSLKFLRSKLQYDLDHQSGLR